VVLEDMNGDVYLFQQGYTPRSKSAVASVSQLEIL